MKLIKHTEGSWQYHLNQNEADFLLVLVKKFPFTEIDNVKISKTDKDPKSVAREKLLNESLAEYRKKLKKRAEDLLGPDKLKQLENGHVLTLDSESKEILLQILNDVRVGCWRALGEPEEPDLQTSEPTKKEMAYRKLMDLAGNFEQSLLRPVR